MEVSDKITPLSNSVIAASKPGADIDNLNYFFIAEEKAIFAANPKKPARVRFGAKTKEEAEKYAEMFKSMLPNSYRYDFRIEKVDKAAIKNQK